MKHMKKVIVVLTAVMILSVPVGVYATTSDSDVATNLRGLCGFGIDLTNLTEEQKEDLDASFNQMMEIKKESINKMVKDGLLTKEQGDQALERLDDMAEYHEENGCGAGMMNGLGNCQGTMENGKHGRGMMGGHY